MTDNWPISEGSAFTLPMDNIDTDQLLPARFMSTPRGEGYGQFLFHDLARGEAGSDSPALLPSETRVLIAGNNFGCGSSREAAVYALVDFGIQAVIAPGFGDIFASNAVNNGLLPAQVSGQDAARLQAHLARGAQNLTVDLAGQTVLAGDLSVAFDIDPVWKLKLLNGWDDIDLTLAQGEAIAAFQAGYAAVSPWAAPDGSEG